jgi:hypothetical protein
MFNNPVHALLRIGRQALAHSHEMIVPAVVEGSRMSLATFLLVLGLLFIFFALQVAFAGEAA